jgi:hypothetical protein
VHAPLSVVLQSIALHGRGCMPWHAMCVVYYTTIYRWCMSCSCRMAGPHPTLSYRVSMLGGHPPHTLYVQHVRTIRGWCTPAQQDGAAGCA